MDKIHHIAIQVKDISKAVAWYQQRFDVELEYQDETWAMLRFDNISLAFVVATQHPHHFAIVRGDAKKFGPLSPHRDGSHSTYIYDTDGNPVEVMQPIPDED